MRSLPSPPTARLRKLLVKATLGLGALLLVLGIGGYYYRQTTDDRQDGERIADNKGRALAIGPSIKYSGKDGWFVTAKWEQETQVRNRAQGDAYWVKLTVPF